MQSPAKFLEATVEFFKATAEAIKEPTYEKFRALHFQLSLIEYGCLVDRGGWKPYIPPKIDEKIRCSYPACVSSWRDGLLNYAGPNDPPNWRCQYHKLEMKTIDDEGSFQQHHIVGEPEFTRERHIEVAKEMAGRWTKYLEQLSEPSTR